MITVDAGNLNRIIPCIGSLQMQADPSSSEMDNTICEEGNAAHWLASTVFHGNYMIDELIDRKAPNGIYITPEMAEHVSDYLNAIDRSPHQKCFMEHDTGYGTDLFRVNGRADFVSHCDTLVNVDDFKYGYTIVEPRMNWTLISHAVGYIATLPFAPKIITLTIHQPRASHHDGRVRYWSISYNELLELYNTISTILSFPTNQLQTGTHCYKCPAFASCPARQAAEMNAIEATGTAFNATLTDDELSSRRDTVSRAIALLKQTEKAYDDQLIHRLKNGHIIKNYGYETDYTNRVWKEGVTPQLMKMITGKDLTKPQLITPRQAEQAGVTSETIAPFTERRSKGMKLIRVSADKKAKKLFGDKQK